MSPYVRMFHALDRGGGVWSGAGGKGRASEQRAISGDIFTSSQKEGGREAGSEDEDAGKHNTDEVRRRIERRNRGRPQYYSVLNAYIVQHWFSFL